MSKDGQLVKGMDRFLRNNVDDEEIFMRWLYVVPDECTDEDCEDIAEDPEQFLEVLKLFADILLEAEQ